jgi:hypothetical protein
MLGEKSLLRWTNFWGAGHPDEPIGPPEDRILGTDLPLVEYRKDLDDVYTGVIDDLKQKEDPEYQQLRPKPYPLLESHFRYAWLMAKSTRTADLSPAGGGASLTDGNGSSARGD